jgi:hypothetical protein
MSDRSQRHLSADEIVVLKLAAHRQLARWAQKRELSPRQRLRRTTLVRAVRKLEDEALVHGCDLHAARDR